MNKYLFFEHVFKEVDYLMKLVFACFIFWKKEISEIANDHVCVVSKVVCYGNIMRLKEISGFETDCLDCLGIQLADHVDEGFLQMLDFFFIISKIIQKCVSRRANTKLLFS